MGRPPAWDAAWLEIGITSTKEFSEMKDKRELRVLSQSIKFSADAAGNSSGGEYPNIKLDGFDSGQVSGRIWHESEQQMLDNNFKYDFTFKAPVTNPDALVGEPLPPGGGKPGQAYLQWVEIVHSGDLEKLKQIVTKDMVAQINEASPKETEEHVALLKSMTPSGVKIIEGVQQDDKAILIIKGSLDGKEINAKVTLMETEGLWIPIGFSI
jgi:hypothetical protein